MAKKGRVCYIDPMVRLILGRAGAGKTARVFEEIAAAVSEGRDSLVLLVPEQYSHEAEREMCRTAGDALSLYGEVLSFTGLARRVFSQCGGLRPMMDGGGRLLCMAAAAASAAPSRPAFFSSSTPRSRPSSIRASRPQRR